MADHRGDIKRFIHQSRAWYGDASLRGRDYVDCVHFGFYSPEGGTSGEMSVKWYELTHDEKPAARLECFEDAFSALGQFTDVIARLAEVNDQHIQPADFCRILTDCGFIDATHEGDPSEAERDDLLRAVRSVEWDGVDAPTLQRVAQLVGIEVPG